MSIRRAAAIAATIILTCSTTGLNAEETPDWESFLPASKLEFTVHYEGQQLTGRFEHFGVEMSFDPERPREGSLKVRVRVTSADMSDREVNAELQEPEWFDGARFEQAVFSSDKIRATGDGTYLATGSLALKGTTSSVAVPFEWRHTPAGAELQGGLTLSRSRWEIGSGEWASMDVLADEVQIRFSVTLQRLD